jgi:hypothetical protein
MTIFTQLRQRETTLDEVQAPFSQALGATAEETWLRSPLSSIGRMRELGRAQDGVAIDTGGEFGFDNREFESSLIPADAARQRIKDADLDLKVPDEGIREGALEILMDRKRDEKRRKDIQSRAEGGFWKGAAHIGVSLGTSLLDPINVASAFIPAVGPARYAAMLAGATGAAGRAGVRAGVGAVEGAVGAAIVEPVVLMAARQEQADYDLADSLLNIALGSVMGGGLHVGFGAAGEAIARRRARLLAGPDGGLPAILDQASPETRAAALRTAVAQAASGRDVDVDRLLRMDARVDDLMSSTTLANRRDGGLASFMDERARVEAEVRAAARAEVREMAPAPAPVREPSLFEFLAKAGGLRDDPELRAVLDGNPTVPGAGRLIRRGSNGMTLDRALEAAAEAGYITDPGALGRGELQKSITDFLEAVDREARGMKVYRAGYVPETQGARPQVDFEQRRIMERLDREMREVGMTPRGDEVEWRAVDLVQRGEEKDLLSAYDRAVMERPLRDPADELDPFDANPGFFREAETLDPFTLAERDSRLRRALDEVREQARADAERMIGRMSDVNASRAADERLKATRDDMQAANDDLAEVLDDVRALARAVGDDAIVSREMAPYDELTRTADAYGRAVQAAAECGLRRG